MINNNKQILNKGVNSGRESINLRKGVSSNLVNVVGFFSALAIFDSLISIYATIPFIIRAPILIAWFIVSLWYISQTRIVHNFIISFFCAIGYAALYGIKLLLGGNYKDDFWAPLYMLPNIVSLLFCVVMVYVVISLPVTTKKGILKVFLILGSITVIPSLIYTRAYPDAIRDAYDGFANVGFQYIYAAVVMVVGSFFVLLKIKKLNYFAFLLVFAVINFYLILKANFATAFVCLLIGIVFMLFCTKKMNVKKFCLILSVLAILFFSLRHVVAGLCYVLAQNAGFSSIMRYRITSIGNFLLGMGGGSSFDNRFDLMNLSWRAFLNSPIFGIDFSLYREGNIGLHETWITSLGAMGIVGTGLLLTSLITVWNSVRRGIINKRFRFAYGILSILYAVMGCLNPMLTRDCLIAFLIIVPLFDCLIRNTKHTRRLQS